MHILLGYQHKTDDSQGFESLLPIGLCSLYAQLRSLNVHATLVNFCGMDDQEILALIRRSKPDVLGLSQWTHNRQSTVELATLVKANLPSCIMVLGGGHASNQAELLLATYPVIDLVAVGEAEQTLIELVAALRSGSELLDVPGLVLRHRGEVVRTAPRRPLADLDQLAFPAAWLHEALNVDSYKQAEYFSSSRGCPAACRFCASPNFWGRKVRYRSVPSVVTEMLQIRDRYGLIYFSMRDDTFTADRRRVVALCQEMLQRELHIFWSCQSRVEAIDPETLGWMRKAGCECIQLGVESGAPEVLKLLGKQITPERIIHAADMIRSVGMNLSVYLISGIPEETPETYNQTLKLLERIRPDDIQVAPLAYYPGTAMFEDAVQRGKLAANLFEINTAHAVLACKDGSRQVERMLRASNRFQHRMRPGSLQLIQQEYGFSAVTAMQLGDYLAGKNDFDGAESQYREITARVPEHPWGWYLLAELYEHAGRDSDALDCYCRVTRLVPRHLQALEAITRLT